MAASESQGSLLVGRLSADGELARHAAFALFARVHLEHTGLVRRQLLDAPGSGGRLTAGLPDAVAAIQEQTPHLVAYFADPARRAALAGLDEPATQELLGWLRAQRVDREEPQIAYELGMLALGVELPPILVRGLRNAHVEPDSRVVELPDGSGYAATFLSTLHPMWRAAERTRLFVEGVDAEQLAAWAMLLLSKQLAPPPGSIERVTREARQPLEGVACDLALVYNPVPWLAAADDYEHAVSASQLLVL
jgi:hypothetical protein